MSASPKYSNITLRGEALKALERKQAEAHQRRLDELANRRRQREAERLRQDRERVRDAGRSLADSIRALRGTDGANMINEALTRIEARLARCTTSVVVAESAGPLLHDLNHIDRELRAVRSRLETLRLNRDLDGLAIHLVSIKAEMAQLDPQNHERFDPGVTAKLAALLTEVEKNIACKQVDNARRGVEQLKEQVAAHIHRVQEGREAHDIRKRAASLAAGELSDRHAAMLAEGVLVAEVKKLAPDLLALARLLAAEQFDNVHHQVGRLATCLDRIAEQVRKHTEQIETQRLTADRLIETVLAFQGIKPDGHGRRQEAQATVLRFSIAGHRALHVKIELNGSVQVWAEGFRHDQRLRADGNIERACDDFVDWFEQIRKAAANRGLDVSALRWDGQPPDKGSQGQRIVSRARPNTAKGACHERTS